MKRIRIEASQQYDVVIGDALLDRCGELCREVISPCRVCIVSDDNVAPLYLERVSSSLNSAGFSAASFVFPNGEASKNINTLTSLLEFLAEQRLTRSDCLIALGGGVVGDLCGFAAAVYLRGIRFIQIPTTLLACVDSSVGGKTGIDLTAGKNLAGAFHQPSLVICDLSTLNTLSPEIFADGCAEVIKYGVIGDRDFFIRLFDGIREHIEDVIAQCVMHKSRIVKADEFESGCRKLLNLGHTVGHAIESCSDFKISHGSAVAIGMVIVTRASVNMGLCPRTDLDLLCELLKKHGLPTECIYSADQLCSVATADKKRDGDCISLILPYSIGNSKVKKIHVSELCKFIKEGL